MMSNAIERRAKLNVDTPTVPVEVRAQKALDAIYVCCFGREPIEEEDKSLLIIMLSTVFPTVERSTIQRIIKDKVVKVAEGSDADNVPEPKPLSKEAVQLQMKDLEFLKQNTENIKNCLTKKESFCFFTLHMVSETEAKKMAS